LGSYADLYIDKYEVSSIKNSIDEFLIFKLFRKNDFKKFTRSLQDRIDNRDYLGDTTKETAYIYQNTVSAIIERLEIQGFTITRAEKAFKLAIRNLIKYEKANITYYKKTLKKLDDFSHHMTEKSLSSIAFFKTYSYTHFQDDVYQITKKRISPFWNESLNRINSFTDYFYNNQIELIYSIEGFHPLFALRTLLEKFMKNKLVTYEMTNIIDGGYVSLDNIDFDNAEKIIILTEGSTDIFIIKESLTLLYPHLKGYYHFFDFHSTNNPGGTSNLVTIIKSFIGSGIKNNIIALFDNDSAGKEALLLLGDISIPKNIKLLSYPNIIIAKSYPTIGPAGKQRMNINGLACSIELYLGKQILQSAKMPLIQWKGFNVKTKTYQGEIQNKSLLFEKFKEQISICKSDPQLVCKYDWSNIQLVLKSIFNSFK